jgi:hypothetical protein
MERITDIAAQNWHGDIANSSKLSTYVLFKTVQCKEEYLGNINNKAFRTALTFLHLGKKMTLNAYSDFIH